MRADGSFVFQAVIVAAFHEFGHGMGAVYFIQGFQNRTIFDDHILKISVYAAAVFPGEIGIDAAETFIAHDGFYHHFAQDPFQRRTLIFIVAVMMDGIPHMEPQKMDHFVDGQANTASMTVQMEHVNAAFPEKARTDGIQGNIAFQIVEEDMGVQSKGVGQRIIDLGTVVFPVGVIRIQLFKPDILQRIDAACECKEKDHPRGMIFFFGGANRTRTGKHADANDAPCRHNTWKLPGYFSAITSRQRIVFLATPCASG